MNPTLNILSGKIAGPSKIVSEQSKEAKTLQNDIKLVGRK